MFLLPCALLGYLSGMFLPNLLSLQFRCSAVPLFLVVTENGSISSALLSSFSLSPQLYSTLSFSIYVIFVLPA